MSAHKFHWLDSIHQTVKRRRHKSTLKNFECVYTSRNVGTNQDNDWNLKAPHQEIQKISSREENGWDDSSV